jgi:hypothetical protein
MNKFFPEVSPQIIAMLKDMGYRDLYVGPSIPHVLTADDWRETIENALGLEPDWQNHDLDWAYKIILSLREIGNSSYNDKYSSFLDKIDEEEIKIALENNENIPHSYVKQLLKEVYFLREIIKSIKKI